MSGRHWSTHSRIVCHLGLAAAWHPSTFFCVCVPNRPWSDQLFSSVQLNFDSLQLNFIYIASVTIKIASRHFTETQSLTSIEATVTGKTPSNKKKPWQNQPLGGAAGKKGGKKGGDGGRDRKRRRRDASHISYTEDAEERRDFCERIPTNVMGNISVLKNLLLSNIIVWGN